MPEYTTLIHAAASRTTGNIDGWTTGYITDGGTYILASDGNYTDSGKPRDLVAILPAKLGDTRVLQLNIAVNTEFIDALREVLD